MRSLSAQNCVSEHRGNYAASSSIKLISQIRDLNKELAIEAVFFLQKREDGKYFPLRVMNDVA